jgi:hypothetical protein
MEDNGLEPLQEALRRHLAPRRHTALLIAIAGLFMVRPLIGDGGLASAAFSVALLMLLLFALYAIQVDELVGERETLLAQRRRRSMSGWALAVPAIAERLAVIFVPSPAIYLVGTILWLLLFVFITWHLLRAVLRQKEVSETISMSISVYLLIGFTWGLFYIVMHHVQPLAFSLGSSPTPISSEQKVFPVAHLLQPDHAFDPRVRRHHPDNSPSSLRGGRRGYHWSVLPGDPGRAPGGNADEPSCQSTRGTSNP